MPAFDGAKFGADRITDLMPGHDDGFLALSCVSVVREVIKVFSS
jgi:hypothetical protein